ncbi:MAG: class I SAM-dependent methyltransferase [Gemmatimonadaceae bacterium]|nr:class I SAM-dependent methyltransferase [Gemmatimonadaceae bacterium]
MTVSDLDAQVVRDAAAGAAGKRGYVQRIFSEIAPRYDLLNRLLSLGIDRAWRTAALRALRWERVPAGRYLDLCAGTLDVGAALVRRPGFAGAVVGADFAEPMLRAGRSKATGVRLAPVVADAVQLPLPDAAVDGAIVAFGIRNVAQLDRALVEVHRVLRPGARFVILEFSTPRFPLVRALYLFYFHHILPIIGGLISGHATAYRYLPESVKHFPERDVLAARLRAAGFTDVSWRALTFGIAALHIGERA